MGDDFELTKKQKIFVENFYQKDFELWNDVFRYVI